MIRARLVAAAVVFLIGSCGGKSKPKKKSISSGPAIVTTDIGVGTAEVRRDLEATILENYSHLSLGNVDAYNDSIARDGTIALFGPRASDLVDAPPVERDRRIYRDANLRYLSKNLEIHLTPDSRAAWIADEISLRVPHEGREAAITMRYSAVYERTYGRWLIRAEHLSVPLASDRAVALAAEGRLSFGRPLRNRGIADDAVVSVVEGVRSTNGRFRSRHIAADRALVWLPNPRGELRGEEAVDGYRWAAYVGGDVVITSVATSAGMIGDDLAWVAEQLRVASARGADLPVRVLSVLQREDGEWRLVHAHTSLPLSRDDIDRLVFK